MPFRRFGGFRPYVTAAERRKRAAAKIAAMAEAGGNPQPVRVEGRKIVTSFWGTAWCSNLERYSDYASRLPRGRTYLRNGAVIHLATDARKIDALVMGSDLYEVRLTILSIPEKRWAAVRRACAGEIRSVLDLLRGNLASGVMAVVTRKGEGLFPTPKEIELQCSCPDWATMCKHVAAVLYGVGVRLDAEPHMLFRLRGVDPETLVAEAVALLQPTEARPREGGYKRLRTHDLSELFGVPIEAPAKKKEKRRRGKKTRRKKTRR